MKIIATINFFKIKDTSFNTQSSIALINLFFQFIIKSNNIVINNEAKLKELQNGVVLEQFFIVNLSNFQFFYFG